MCGEELTHQHLGPVWTKTPHPKALSCVPLSTWSSQDAAEPQLALGIRPRGSFRPTLSLVPESR